MSHPCVVGWKSLSHIQFLKLKDDCSESKRASDTRLGPQKVPVNNPGIIYCRMLFFIQYLLYNSQLDDLLEEYLPGLTGPKESRCLVSLGSELLHGLDADGAPKPAGSSETRSPDGVGWELSRLNNSLLSARGLKETWKAQDTLMSVNFHSFTSLESSPTHPHQSQTPFHCCSGSQVGTVEISLLGQPQQPENQGEALKTHTHPYETFSCMSKWWRELRIIPMSYFSVFNPNSLCPGSSRE